MSCRRPVDLSWVDVDSLQASIAVVKGSPKDDDWMASDLENNINDFVEANKKIFIQFEVKPLLEPSTSEINISAIEIVLSTVSTSKSIFGVLMNKMNSFPKVKQNASLRTSKQYNTIVNFIISRKFGVKAGCLTDYDRLVKYFSELLWEIDPHYHKLKTLGMLLLESVEKNFIGFNKPASDGHAPKRLSSEPLSLKVQNLYQHTDRNCMDSSHMKPLKEMLLTVAEKVIVYLTQLEEQNVRTKKGHVKTCHSNTIEDFVVRNISTYTSGKTVWSEGFSRIREVLQSKDVCKPIVVNEFIQANKRTMFMTIIKRMIERGLPFQLKEYSISCYKLPSFGSHSAVHFLWKKSINDSANCPEQLKTIHDLKNKSKTYYSRTKKHEVRKTILRLGIVKPCQTNFITKDLLGEESAASDEYQKNVLDSCI